MSALENTIRGKWNVFPVDEIKAASVNETYNASSNVALNCDLINELKNLSVDEFMESL